MSELALRLIAENKAKHARGEDARVLDLGNCGLSNLPKELYELSWIEKLLVSDKSIPTYDDYRERWIPEDYESHPNNLKIIDEDIGHLISLKSLAINGEQLLNQWCVKSIEPLKELKNLEHLNISNNLIESILPLSFLKKLKFLNISGNRLTSLNGLEELFQIESLHASFNGISDLTPIAKLSKLRHLDLRNNKIESIRVLVPLIKKNVPVLWGLGGGACIGISANPLKMPPIEIVQQGNAAILQYFEELELAKSKNQTIRLSEAKCLILGEGGAGKTSLTRKLLSRESQLPTEKETTQGVDIHPHDLKLPDGTDFRLNIWDFGGQEIYHATHQFFLTKRSLYILLDDTRTSDKTVNDASFNYWLQIAELYGGNSPLLIVQNEKGDRSKQLDLRGMQGHFGFVKDSKATNLLTCRGLDEVWTAIEYWLKQLPHIGEEQPKAWVDIRRELERLAREESRDHIPLEEYYRICAQHDIPERERALFLSSYLHDFGAFLHFQDHPLLRKTLVLNNQWATDAVYKVLDCEEVKGSFGRFTRSTLGRIWASDRYADQHDELLALMEKFELCYKLPDERADTWLAPQLLSVLQPEALEWETATEGVTQSHTLSQPELQIRYEYEFMPKGLLSQHIVRNHRYIRQTELAWKSGAVFERAGAQALVTEAWGSRNIRIRARGTNAKELLTLLSEDFAKMHERLEGLKVRKMIPCNCRVCAKSPEPHFYDHEKLQRRRMDGKRTVECDLSYEDVSVVGLLDGVFVKVIEPNHNLNQSIMSAKKVFISYSHKDEALKEELDAHLTTLKRTGLVEVWQDRRIDAGTEWDDEIKAELEAADIILLLISANFIASKYIWEVEIAHAMERHHAKTARVIPIFLRACDMKDMPFEKIQGLPRDAKPVVSFSDKDEAYLQIARGIRSVLEK